MPATDYYYCDDCQTMQPEPVCSECQRQAVLTGWYEDGTS